MPSFFSKVFGRKKDDKESSDNHSRRYSASADLLEGKYEAVSPTASPTADKFKNELSRQQFKDKEKDGFSLLRPRSRSAASPKTDTGKSASSTPHLELNLTVGKEIRGRALGVVFEGADERGNLPESVIGERRLTPPEALVLVKACAAALVEHGGLETLGVMHPHWYSASPEVQRRLISLFILSLASSSPDTTLAPNSDSPSRIFDSELTYTRSPHDIAAVLRWALRHLRLEGPSFGSSEGEDHLQWYTKFAEAERGASFPPNAFSQSLIPSLPSSHLQLLTATLDIISSLAAHAETNGGSGSKLTKFLGLWLLAVQRALETDDWTAFYARWERAGRIFEHIFLSYLRNEAEKKSIPLRLAELVKHYPYATSLEQDDHSLLPRPRFSTRRYDALFVRVLTELPTTKTPKPKQHPLKLIAQAFGAEVVATGDLIALWEQLKQAASNGTEKTDAQHDDSLALSRIFDDDTLRMLSLIPNGSDITSKTITLSAPTPREGRPVRRRSTSLGPASKPNGTHGNSRAANGKTHSIVSPTPTSVPLPPSPTDWADFSTTGFGEMSLGKDLASTLLDDDDVEVTSPPHAQPKRKASGKKRKATSSPPTSRRSSADSPRPLSQRSPPEPSPVDVLKTAKTQASFISLVKLDEAFVDFWTDSLTDPIMTSNWPTFVLCQLKPSAPITANTPDGKSISWLVIEHAFTYPPPPPEPTSPTSPTSATKRASSPRPSVQSNLSSRKGTTFSSRRFNFFGGNSSADKSTATPSTTAKTGFTLKNPVSKKRAPKVPRIGEMGEVLPEVEESPKSAEPEVGLGISPVEKSQPAAVDPVASPTSEEPPKDVSASDAKIAPATVPEVEQKEDSPAAEAAPAPQTESLPETQVAPEVNKPDELPAVAGEQSAPQPGETVTPANPAAETIIAPSTESTPPELSPVPVLDAVPTQAPDAPAPVAVEPVVLEKESQERPTISHPAVLDVAQVDTETEVPEATTVGNAETLPPAPVPVVLSGSTPGPQVALSTSEPEALAEVVVPEVQEQHTTSESMNVGPQEITTAPTSTADVPAPESINIEPTTVKQEELSPVSLPASPSEVNQVEVSPAAPEIPVEGSTAQKGEDPADPEGAEHQQDAPEVSPVPAADNLVTSATKPTVAQSELPKGEATTDPNAEVGVSAVQPTTIEPALGEHPTLPEPIAKDENTEGSLAEVSPRADNDLAPLSEPAEANTEPVAASLPVGVEPEASAPPVPSATPLEERSQQGAVAQSHVADDAGDNNTAEASTAETDIVLEERKPTIMNGAALPTTGAPEPATEGEPAEVGQGATDGSGGLDVSAVGSISTAPEITGAPTDPPTEVVKTSAEESTKETKVESP